MRIVLLPAKWGGNTNFTKLFAHDERSREVLSVDQPPLAKRKLPSACPQASPVDKRPAELTKPERINETSAIRLVEGYQKVENV